MAETAIIPECRTAVRGMLVDEVVYGLTMTPCSGFSQPRQLGPKSLSDLRTSQPHRNHGARVVPGCNRLWGQSPGRGRGRGTGVQSLNECEAVLAVNIGKLGWRGVMIANAKEQ